MNQEIVFLQQIIGREVFEKYQYRDLIITLQEEIEKLKKELEEVKNGIQRPKD